MTDDPLLDMVRAGCDNIAKLHAALEAVARLEVENAGLRAEMKRLHRKNAVLQADHDIVQLLTRLIRATRPIWVEEADDEPS